MPKKLSRGFPLGFSNIHSVPKLRKIERGTLWGILFSKKSLAMPKKIERGPFSLSRYCMLREKRGKTFLVQFARPNDAIWDHKIL